MQQHLRKSLLIVALASVGSLVYAGNALHTPSAAPTTLRALYGMTPPRQLSAPHTALLFVDFQDEFVHGRLPLPAARSAVLNAAALADWARAANIAVIHVRNEVTRPGSPVFAAGSATTAFIPELTPKPGELVITKSIAGAFSRTNLHDELQARHIDTLIIAGLMTHLAVAITATDAAVLGYHTVVAADAVTTRALPGAGGQPSVDAVTLQRAALATLADRVADVLSNLDLFALPITRT